MESRTLIEKAYNKAKDKGYNQTKWSSEAGYAVNGQTVSRIMKSGDCRVSTLIELLKTINCKLVIQDENNKNI